MNNIDSSLAPPVQGSRAGPGMLEKHAKSDAECFDYPDSFFVVVGRLSCVSKYLKNSRKPCPSVNRRSQSTLTVPSSLKHYYKIRSKIRSILDRSDIVCYTQAIFGIRCWRSGTRRFSDY